MDPLNLDSSARKKAQQQALSLAHSPATADQLRLRALLTDPSFLDQLDGEQELEGPFRRLRLAKVIKVLLDHAATPARDTLTTLTHSPLYADDPPRTQLLIEAWAEIRPAPEEAVQFWDDHCKPRDGYSHRTVRMLVLNRSEPALKLLGKILVDPEQPQAHKVHWLRSFVIEARNDELLLRLSAEIQSKLSAPLQVALIEVLFDYQKSWYRPHGRPDVPSRSAATSEALQILSDIGHWALRDLDLSATLQATVRQALEQVESDRSPPR
jgi:hypothetical protein